jgi:hypothetical protein
MSMTSKLGTLTRETPSETIEHHSAISATVK